MPSCTSLGWLLIVCLTAIAMLGCSRGPRDEKGEAGDPTAVRGSQDDQKSDESSRPDEDDKHVSIEPTIERPDRERDSDGDGLSDYEENEGWIVSVAGSRPRKVVSDPTRPDTDGDRLTDDYERELGTDPADADTDGDGQQDGDDRFPLLSNLPRDADVWYPRISSDGSDLVRAIAVDQDQQVCLFGQTDGTLPESQTAGHLDVFLAKYDLEGSSLWARQFGGSDNDQAHAAVIDREGNIYVAGYAPYTLGSGDVLDLQPVNPGNQEVPDASPAPETGALKQSAPRVFYTAFQAKFEPTYSMFIAKFSPSGETLWTQQWFEDLGSDWLRSHIKCTGMAIAGDAVCLVYNYRSVELPNVTPGHPFLVAFDMDGNFLWRKNCGAPQNDVATAVTADAEGNVYIAGNAYSSSEHGWKHPNGSDVFLIRVDSDGTERWRKQLDLPDENEYAKGITVDDTGVYTAATVTPGGDPRAPERAVDFEKSDVLLIKYDASGNLIWQNRFRTAAEEDLSGIAADGLGLVYLTGNFRNGAASKVFLSCYSLDGQQAWEKSVQLEFGSPEGEKQPKTGIVQDIAIDDEGIVYVTGHGSAGDPQQKQTAFVLKFARKRAPQD